MCVGSKEKREGESVEGRGIGMSGGHGERGVRAEVLRVILTCRRDFHCCFPDLHRD